ncbi:heparinase II/III family protein [Thalassotalea euphylliae]|uniref:heparinase II/III domain-containing protein n=1 Tax=Thalassotalea euphylliae TaxID=1655234 RepID=UPI00363627E8
MLAALSFTIAFVCLPVALGFSNTAIAKEYKTTNSSPNLSPNLVVSYKDLPEMRTAVKTPGRFADKYHQLKENIDQQLTLAIDVPVPADGGGGYTHERHKKNYQLMYNAGVIYQISQDKKYANFVRNILLDYVALYPTIGLHPKRKVKSQNPGKFFWQSLNEAVWLVYTIQAYDLVRDALTEQDIASIEEKLLKPVAIFLSEGQPSTFNKVHNHGTWATAGVGMAGYVMNEPEWVEKALLDLDKSGKGGFLRQLDELFSPQGYYNEGPYYQRYALMPFVTFAKAIENNEPQRNIFKYRDGIVLKAITTTIELSYNGLFFPINDAIKSKGIDTIELVNGVTVAYGRTGDTGLLDIAGQQQQIILTGDGLKVARALDAGLATPYQYQSVAFGDGANGNEGALVVMRQHDKNTPSELGQTLLFKPAAQGLGHGHFDKLTWQFYDQGAEIVSDYGAARFLNVEAKFGGRYLPENNSYAKQTVAHNTVVVDETSHFNAKVKVGNANHPELLFYENNKHGSVSSATINTAYDGVTLTRTVALVQLPTDSKAVNTPIALDIFAVSSSETHQYDLPLHYQGQLIESNFERDAFTQQLSALGNNNGYQHLWLTANATPAKGIAQITWLNDNGRFYTQTSSVDGDTEVLFTRIGANDPEFNLRNESAFIYRKKASKNHKFVSVLEPHGQYNPAKEFTLSAQSNVKSLKYKVVDTIDIVELVLKNNSRYLLAINNATDKSGTFTYDNKNYSFDGRMTIIQIENQD